MRLVGSSTPGAVERDQAIVLLIERAVLTRMVCREIAESDIDHYDRRPITALYQLLKWVYETHGSHVRGEPRADDGLKSMIVPDGYEPLLSEIEAGAKVCNALFMLTTADTGLQASSDRERIRSSLAAYQEKHPAAFAVGALIG